jgi:hypothetical protein
MALLYLVEDGVAMDEQGSQWTLDDHGVWQPGLERRSADLHLVTNDNGLEDVALRPMSDSERAPVARPSWVNGEVRAAR